MAGKRIYELLEKSTLEGTDYVAVDGSSLGEARKVAASKLLNFTNVAGSSDEYSSSKAYKVGDLVIHDNKLYKCTTACAAAPWSTNQGYFTQTTLASFGTDLKSSLTIQKIDFSTVSGVSTRGKIYKMGSLVWFNTIANLSTATTDKMISLGTLIPEGCRPSTGSSSGVLINCVDNTNDIVIEALLGDTGTITLYRKTGETPSASVFRVSASYFIG